jgi:hypothetical protein
VNLPPTHPKINLVNGDETAEVLAQAAGFEDEVLGCVQSRGGHSNAYETPYPGQASGGAAQKTVRLSAVSGVQSIGESISGSRP